MEIGKKMRALRQQKNLTQEELAERTDLSKGYISQLENNLSSPSLETFFNLLEVLGTTPKEFFEADSTPQAVVYTSRDVTVYEEPEKGYTVTWLIADSNEKEMEPIMLALDTRGEYKLFPPSSSETFGHVLKGSIELQIGDQIYPVKKGQSFYYEASKSHQIRNASVQTAKVLLVATDSYL